jgi:hypothetical protein
MVIVRNNMMEVMMQYAVDARIEKGQPRLRVLDATTGEVHMEWSLTRVNEMLEEGEIPPKDFLHPERYGMKLLLKNLFLLSCIESMDGEHNNNGKACSLSQNVVEISERRKILQDSQTEWQFGIKAHPI